MVSYRRPGGAAGGLAPRENTLAATDAVADGCDTAWDAVSSFAPLQTSGEVSGFEWGKTIVGVLRTPLERVAPPRV